MSKRASRDACPLCGSPPSADTAPFCGRGCRDRDLLNWLGEGYQLPGPAAVHEDAANRTDGLDSGEPRT